MQSSTCIHTRDRYNMIIKIQPSNVILYSEYKFEIVYIRATHTTHSCTVGIVCVCVCVRVLCLRVIFPPKNDIFLSRRRKYVDIIALWINRSIIYTYKESNLACSFFSYFSYRIRILSPLYVTLWLSNIYKTNIHESSAISYKYSGRKDHIFFLLQWELSAFS